MNRRPSDSSGVESLNRYSRREGLMELLKSVVVPYERLQQALDASAQGSIVFDNSRISFVNAAARLG